MKYAKSLGPICLALAMVMATTGLASATTLTSPSGTTYTSAVKIQNQGAITLTGPFGFGTISCGESVMEGKVETHGSSVTAGWNLSKWTFIQCTGGEPTTSTHYGALQFHGTSTTGNATVTQSNLQLVIHKTLLGTCTFSTASTGTHLGTLTGSNITGGNAILHTSSTVPGTCGSGALEGTWKVITPSTLEVH